ncbi:MAG: UDP-N-acetylmuramoyl-L-alanyl-D-glutamate--2,6-diaminopimelate ligase [bacterium]|nr:UDP-N-acetylmuramoyl-L-alanyl-D-glutamate--2,6-diaminopimelate ligase [bacterium]
MITLKELFKTIDVFTHIKRQVTGITLDSRKVIPGYIFVALKGVHSDGYDYIVEAILKGAICIIADRDFKSTSKADFDRIITPNVYELASKFALLVYDNPSTKLKVIGITGTNGKTTTTYILEAIFRKVGFKTGIIGTIQNKIDDKITLSENTTPFPTELQGIFYEMVQAGVQYVFMEVSSHALELGRVYGTEFAAAVFMNLTKEHLDFHINMKNYALAKKKLFDMLPDKAIAVVNKDSKYSREMYRTPIQFSRKTKSDFTAKNIKFDRSGCMSHFDINNMKINTKLVGMHNVENILAAVAVAVSFGIVKPVIEKALQELEGVNGRFEFVRAGQDFACIVDYAHTSDSLAQVLRTCRKLKMNRIITVFGCGGDRDRKKRPLMAKASAKYSDYVILTNDNPRDENPKRILTDIEVGFNEVGFLDYEIIEDREEAIRVAINMANTYDLVLIAGKGHENYQICRGEHKLFLDKKVAHEKIRDILTANIKPMLI